MKGVRIHYLIITAIALAAGLWLATTAQAQEADQNRAALVMRFDEGDVATYCVAFEEPEITGLELLQRSGVALEIEDIGMGVTVCRVDETGCPADNCFCECQGGECRYWSYWYQNDGQWRYAALGAHARMVGDGVVEGWSWGPGSVSEATSPPPVTFEEVCAADDEAPDEAVGAGESGEQAAVATEMPAADATAANQPPAAGEGENNGQSGLTSYVVFGVIAVLLLAALFAGRLARRRG
ncbi:MAG TPA: hypothetical protein VK879_16430 [Candidatus Sulfomarinibacteraceae bacterium]|nr:hypothetical protein [Candidatus Sulfomarinibacteraceae bacterium]